MRLYFAIIVNELKDHVNRAYEEGGSGDFDTEKVKRYIFFALKLFNRTTQMTWLLLWSITKRPILQSRWLLFFWIVLHYYSGVGD